jgi:hypothetical protein
MRPEALERRHTVTERDPMLRRTERGAIVACLAMAAAAWVIARGRVDAPLGVAGGGLLVLISYRGIKGGIDGLVEAGPDGGAPRQRAAIGLVKFFTRYAILAAAAYVIMARLRLPPVAVCAGASSLVVAVMVEAARGVAPRRR